MWRNRCPYTWNLPGAPGNCSRLRRACSCRQKGGYAEIEVEVLEEDDILRGLGPKTTVWASHADEVAILPDGFIHLARSDVCEIEAMRHPTKPIYGVQWHPEVSHTKKGEELLMNFFEVCDRH